MREDLSELDRLEGRVAALSQGLKTVFDQAAGSLADQAAQTAGRLAQLSAQAEERVSRQGLELAARLRQAAASFNRTALETELAYLEQLERQWLARVDAALEKARLGSQEYRLLLTERAAFIRAVEAEIARVRLEATDNLAAGARAGLSRWLNEQKTWYQRAEQEAEATANALTGAFGDFFFDAMTGELKSLDEYFQQFARSVINQISQMLAQWVAFKAVTSAMSFGAGFGAGSGELVGAPAGTISGGAAVNVGAFDITPSARPAFDLPINLAPAMTTPRLANTQAPPPRPYQPKITVHLTNNTGVETEASVDTRVQGDELVLGIVLDGIRRNKRGARDIIREVTRIG